MISGLVCDRAWQQTTTLEPVLADVRRVRRPADITLGNAPGYRTVRRG
jgi:hypothetical protein